MILSSVEKGRKNAVVNARDQGPLRLARPKISLISAQLDDDDANFPSSHGPGFGEATRQQISPSPVIFHVRIVIFVEIHEAENAA